MCHVPSVYRGHGGNFLGPSYELPHQSCNHACDEYVHSSIVNECDVSPTLQHDLTESSQINHSRETIRMVSVATEHHITIKHDQTPKRLDTQGKLLQ